jgi:hypothetical protein
MLRFTLFVATIKMIFAYFVLVFFCNIDHKVKFIRFFRRATQITIKRGFFRLNLKQMAICGFFLLFFEFEGKLKLKLL